MKSRLLLVLGTLGLLAFAAGCASGYPKCKSDQDCNVDGHTGVCVNGMCEECGRDSDCKEGFKCEIQQGGGNRCVPAAPCNTTADCTGGKVCKSGACVPCSSDGECGPNAECRAGACQPKAQCTADEDCGSGQSCVEGACIALGTPCEQGPVYFSFDDYSLTEESRRSLQDLAECLRTENVTVTLEGHCDERGTDEYNMSLGEKRASSVKRYLSNLGVDGSRLRTVSYGKERPAAYGSNEEAWAKNRRVEFVVTR